MTNRGGVEGDGVGWEALFILSGGCEASQLLLAHHSETRRVLSSLPSAYLLEAAHSGVVRNLCGHIWTTWSFPLSWCPQRPLTARQPWSKTFCFCFCFLPICACGNPPGIYMECALPSSQGVVPGRWFPAGFFRTGTTPLAYLCFF